MPRNPQESRRNVWRAAREVIRREGIGRFTIDQVATHAKCAKGLVLYHYKTRDGLTREVIERHAAERQGRWRAALAVPDAPDAIRRTWAEIMADRPDAEVNAGLAGHASEQIQEACRVADADFVAVVSEGLAGLMERMGLEFDVPAGQAGALLAAGVQGSATRLACGAPEDEVEEAYALVWLSLLELTVPTTGGGTS